MINSQKLEVTSIIEVILVLLVKMKNQYSEEELAEKGYTVYRNTLVINFDRDYDVYMYDATRNKGAKKYEGSFKSDGYRIIPISCITKISIMNGHNTLRFSLNSGGMAVDSIHIPLKEGLTVKSILDDIYGGDDKVYHQEDDLICI